MSLLLRASRSVCLRLQWRTRTSPGFHSSFAPMWNGLMKQWQGDKTKPCFMVQGSIVHVPTD
eukprot:10786417-Prorocentrum_lima.AAC.1